MRNDAGPSPWLGIAKLLRLHGLPQLATDNDSVPIQLAPTAPQRAAAANDEDQPEPDARA